jgi:hypothetical protein
MGESRWDSNLKQPEKGRLRDLLNYNLRTVRAYLLKEDFQQLWEYASPTWAGKFLDQWCQQTLYSKIEPMKKVARTLRAHRELIVNWFKAKKRFSSGIVEGLNNKAKLTMRKSYGFRSPEILKWLYIMRLENCLNRKWPMNSTDEAKILVVRKRIYTGFPGCPSMFYLYSFQTVRHGGAGRKIKENHREVQCVRVAFRYRKLQNEIPQNWGC